MKKLIVACAGGVATSTLICSKIEDYIKEQQLPVQIYQCRISEIKANLSGACAVVSSARLVEDYGVPSLLALSLITGVGVPQFFEKLKEAIQ